MHFISYEHIMNDFGIRMNHSNVLKIIVTNFGNFFINYNQKILKETKERSLYIKPE